MEPVTHFLTGACLGRAGFNRKTAYATLAMVLAAEAPDIDALWAFGGPVASFQHHRGITHTLVGAPFVALLVTGAIWLWHRFRKKKPAQEVHWWLVWLFSLVAVLSHLVLDYTNSYGLRPFFPFNPRWYSGDIVFIFEPVIFAFLLLAMLVPALLGLVDRDMGVKRPPFRGRGWAIFGLVAMVLVWTVRVGEHQHALRLVENGGLTSEKLLKVGVHPYPVTPFKWFAVVETPEFFQTGTIDTRRDAIETDPAADVTYKPPVTLATLAAKRSRLGQVYLDWAQFPVTEDRGLEPAPGSNLPVAPGGTSVQFRDLRFSYASIFVRGDDPPLSGWVYVGPSREIDAMFMNGQEQN